MKSSSNFAAICARQLEKLHRAVFLRDNYEVRFRGLDKICSDDVETVTAGFRDLVSHLWSAHKHYLLPGSTIAYYPGLPSIYGATNDGIEGVTRLLPLWAAFTLGAELDKELTNEISHHLLRSITNGTNPEHSGYWGDIQEKSTLICEAADIALALWIGKKRIWEELDSQAKEQVVSWLAQVIGKDTADNNWHLFVVLIDLVICDLDPRFIYCSGDRYSRVKSFYLGDGCFRDGPTGQVDLYNAWGFHYSLFWISQIRPEFDPEFIRDSLMTYCAWYQYSFSSSGVLLYGRSLLYRTALPCPLIIRSIYDNSETSRDIAMSALASCWSYFVAKGALEYGKLTQGVFEENFLWTDPYSGPASSFWGTRSLVLFFYLSGNNFWKTAKLTPLPAETDQVQLDVPAAGFRLSTCPSKRNIRLTIEGNDKEIGQIVFDRPSARARFWAFRVGVVSRVSNNLITHGLRNLDSFPSPYEIIGTQKY